MARKPYTIHQGIYSITRQNRTAAVRLARELERESTICIPVYITDPGGFTDTWFAFSKTSDFKNK